MSNNGVFGCKKVKDAYNRTRICLLETLQVSTFLQVTLSITLPYFSISRMFDPSPPLLRPLFFPKLHPNSLNQKLDDIRDCPNSPTPLGMMAARPELAIARVRFLSCVQSLWTAALISLS